MNFDLSEEQRLLAASIERFVARDYSFEARRRIVASPEGYSREAWKILAGLGLIGLAIPAELGGLGGRASDMASVMDAIGAALIVEPFLATALGGRIIVKSGSATQQQALLPPVAAGECVLAFAHMEAGARYNLAHVAARARKTSDGFAIDGDKRVVLHAPCAQLLVVSARLSGNDADPDGIALFLVKTDAPGVSMSRYRTLDELPAADIAFSNVRVTGDARLGQPSSALPAIEEAVDYATALVLVEAVGALGYANDPPLDYVKDREQFGVAIRSFQA